MILMLTNLVNDIFQWKTYRYDLFKYGDVLVVCIQEVFEGTKEVIRIRISKKNKITAKITTEFPNKKQKPIIISDNNTWEAIAIRSTSTFSCTQNTSVSITVTPNRHEHICAIETRVRFNHVLLEAGTPHPSHTPMFAPLFAAHLFIFCVVFFICLSSSCVMCSQWCQCLWIVYSWMPLRFSLIFI